MPNPCHTEMCRAPDRGMSLTISDISPQGLFAIVTLSSLSWSALTARCDFTWQLSALPSC